MVPLRGYATYYNATCYSEVAPVKSNTCCSSDPYLRRNYPGGGLHKEKERIAQLEAENAALENTQA